MSCLNEYWDKKYGLNIQYMPMPQDYKISGKIKIPADDYDIVVLSNSRWAAVRDHKKHIDALLHYLPNETLFTDIQLWYMALNRLIVNTLDLNKKDR